MGKSLSASFSGFGSRQLFGAAGYSGERLRFGDSLEVVVLFEGHLLHVIVLHPRV